MKTFFVLTTGLLSGFFIGVVAMAWAYEDDQNELNDLRNKEKLNKELLEELSKREV